jgi:hypothetical protein
VRGSKGAYLSGCQGIGPGKGSAAH